MLPCVRAHPHRPGGSRDEGATRTAGRGPVEARRRPGGGPAEPGQGSVHPAYSGGFSSPIPHTPPPTEAWCTPGDLSGKHHLHRELTEWSGQAAPSKATAR